MAHTFVTQPCCRLLLPTSRLCEGCGGGTPGAELCHAMSSVSSPLITCDGRLASQRALSVCVCEITAFFSLSSWALLA